MSEPVPRWSLVTSAGPYALLAFLTVITVPIKHRIGESPVPDLIVCGLLAAWMLVMVTLRPAWRDNAPRMAVFVAGVVLCSLFLVISSPWFGFLSPVGYLYALRLLHWPWQLLGVAGVAVAAGTAQASGVDKSTAFGVLVYLAVLAANVLPMCGYAAFARRAEQKEQEREQALAAAREANRLLAASLAENAALHEQLLTQARDAGVREERQRMAREIHDTLAQGLTGIISQLRAADTADPVASRKHVAAADKLARESLTEARRSVHALRPEPLRAARLGEALAGVAHRWSALHEIPVRVTTTGAVRPIRPEAEAALLRIAQEALANVAQHARARRVGLTLSYLEEEAALDIRDDGDGFDPARIEDPRPDRGGFGLIAMRQRMTELSGTLQVESEPGAGTGISARVPLELAEVCA
ncbi:sensor histidine kinase [Crossiella cryophila]|uniref:Signal transduction histidine kinase n=1 Tax=Crossiella cryophila TaxID=43355 RepID=A0A7W7CGW9_9PSEU|nr:sensor histidine kinase [Crossiella cryophila]MBB4679548.1 signal transduction histidine kinase [Crossiella cryophila]